ncbi:MAG: TIGR04348 family glycosyltransferase [Rhodocyclaceae bacterium]|jgi:putative glycosyltransferase (TIGR04348 family)|nr:TIGR04348 family glycosyltransferase [Rhodocyclaceae bacterium]
MPAARVIIVTPAPPGSRAGNRNTATRWARILRGLGCRVSIRTEWDGSACDLMVALHARRSHASIKSFRVCHPDKPAVLALTGTDVYRDIHNDPDAGESLELATRLIVLQEAALAELTAGQRARARVIHQSVATPLACDPPYRVFRAAVLGHLREEKDPFRMALALRHFPRTARIQVVQAGKPLSAAMEKEASRLMRIEPRYRWVGELPHWKTMRLLSRSNVMVISSVLEGGAHVVSEAIALGVPVIASDIPGNRGLLGDDYPACFPVGDDAALAGLVQRAMEDEDFLRELGSAVIRRRPLVSPRREAKAWRKLLAELGLRTFRKPGSGPASRSRS